MESEDSDLFSSVIQKTYLPKTQSQKWEEEEEEEEELGEIQIFKRPKIEANLDSYLTKNRQHRNYDAIIKYFTIPPGDLLRLPKWVEINFQANTVFLRGFGYVIKNLKSQTTENFEHFNRYILEGYADFIRRDTQDNIMQPVVLRNFSYDSLCDGIFKLSIEEETPAYNQITTQKMNDVILTARKNSRLEFFPGNLKVDPGNQYAKHRNVIRDYYYPEVSEQDTDFTLKEYMFYLHESFISAIMFINFAVEVLQENEKLGDFISLLGATPMDDFAYPKIIRNALANQTVTPLLQIREIQYNLNEAASSIIDPWARYIDFMEAEYFSSTQTNNTEYFSPRQFGSNYKYKSPLNPTFKRFQYELEQKFNVEMEKVKDLMQIQVTNLGAQLKKINTVEPGTTAAGTGTEKFQQGKIIENLAKDIKDKFEGSIEAAKKDTMRIIQLETEIKILREECEKAKKSGAASAAAGGGGNGGGGGALTDDQQRAVNGLRQSTVNSMVQKMLREKISNIRFAFLVAGLTVKPDEKSLLQENIESVLQKQVFRDPRISGPDNVFERISGSNNFQRINIQRTTVQKVIEEEIEAYKHLFDEKTDGTISVDSGLHILSAELFAFKTMATQFVCNMLRNAHRRNATAGFSQHKGSWKNNEPRIDFIMMQDIDKNPQPPFLPAFAKLTASLLSKSEKTTRKVAGTHFDNDPINIEIGNAKMYMRQTLIQGGFAVLVTEQSDLPDSYLPVDTNLTQNGAPRRHLLSSLFTLNDTE